MLQGEHSAIRSTFIKLQFVIKIFVFSIFEWPLRTGFTVLVCFSDPQTCFHSVISHLLAGKMRSGCVTLQIGRKSRNISTGSVVWSPQIGVSHT